MGLIKLLIDDRNGGGDDLLTHRFEPQGVNHPAQWNICDAFDKAGGADVIIADEAQFLLRNRWIRWARWWMNAICRCSASRRGRIFRSISLMARCLMELADFYRQSQNDLCLRAQGRRQRPHCPAGEQRCLRCADPARRQRELSCDVLQCRPEKKRPAIRHFESGEMIQSKMRQRVGCRCLLWKK